MGLFFSKPMILNELVRTGPNGEKENLDDEDKEKDEDIGAPSTEDDNPPDNDTGDDEDLGGDMPTDDDEDEPPADEGNENDDSDLGDDMPTDDEGGDDEGTVGDDTDYNIPDEGGEDTSEGADDDSDLGDDMPTDDGDVGEDDPDAGAGDDTGEGGDDEGDLGDDMPTDDDGSDSTDTADGGTGDTGGGDAGDTGTDNTDDQGSDSETGTGTKSAEEIEAIEKELFSDLTDEQMAIKHVELKSNFIAMYESIGDIIERVNKIPKTDFNIKSLEFVGIKLNELRSMIHYNLTEGYQTRGYTENMMIYQQCLVTLNTISELLDELAPEKPDSKEEKD